MGNPYDNLRKRQEATEEALERARLEFIAEHEAGNAPTLEAFLARYPRQYAARLTEFVLDYLRLAGAERREGATGADRVAEAPAPAYAVAAWERALGRLGIDPAVEKEAEEAAVRTLAGERAARGLSLAALARGLRLPVPLALKVERGQFAAWPERLTDALAEALSVARDRAEAILAATAAAAAATGGSATAAAYSAEGDPEVEAVAARRREALEFDAALEAERRAGRLTREQDAFWRGGDSDREA